MGSHEKAIYSTSITLVFVPSPSEASERDCFVIVSHPRENQLARRFFCKIQFAVALSHFLMLGLFYAHTQGY